MWSGALDNVDGAMKKDDFHRMIWQIKDWMVEIWKYLSMDESYGIKFYHNIIHIGK